MTTENIPPELTRDPHEDFRSFYEVDPDWASKFLTRDHVVNPLARYDNGELEYERDQLWRESF